MSSAVLSPVSDQQQIVVFTLEETRCALFLSAVERVFRAVEITRLPNAPESIFGVINLHGQVIPVVDIRKTFNLSSSEIGLDDRLIVVRTSRRRAALIATTVDGVRQFDEPERISAAQVLRGTKYLRGLAKLEDGLALIFDLDQFLSMAEEQVLDAALVEEATKRRITKSRKTRNENKGKSPR